MTTMRPPAENLQAERWLSAPTPRAWPTPSETSINGLQWSSSWEPTPSVQKNKSGSKFNSIPNQIKTSRADESSLDKLSSEVANLVLGEEKVDGNRKSTNDVETQRTRKEKFNIEDELSKQNLYKTEMCRSFVETGTCRYGHKCQFAHGSHELRPVLRHPKYKTEICKTYSTTGQCPYGNRCRFIHPVSTPTQASTNWSLSWGGGNYNAQPSSQSAGIPFAGSPAANTSKLDQITQGSLTNTNQSSPSRLKYMSPNNIVIKPPTGANKSMARVDHHLNVQDDITMQKRLSFFQELAN